MPKIHKYTIAIDPSINTCGISVFDGKKLLEYKLLKPEKGLRKSHYLMKCRSMVDQIEFVYDTYRSKGFVTLVTEVPQHFGAAERGFLGRESGAVFKLTFVCGMIYNIAKDVVAYEPQEWKGQLPKDVFGLRLQKEYPKLKIMKTKSNGKFVSRIEEGKKVHVFEMDHNIVDAIGIGHRHVFGRV